jgi:hypothetical protein
MLSSILEEKSDRRKEKSFQSDYLFLAIKQQINQIRVKKPIKFIES